jgi:hypothetical protein
VQNPAPAGVARTIFCHARSGFLFVRHASRLANSACLEANMGWKWQEFVANCRLYAPVTPNIRLCLRGLVTRQKPLCRTAPDSKLNSLSGGIMARDVYLQIDGTKGKGRWKYSQQKISGGGAGSTVGEWNLAQNRTA